MWRDLEGGEGEDGLRDHAQEVPVQAELAEGHETLEGFGFIVSCFLFLV